VVVVPPGTVVVVPPCKVVVVPLGLVVVVVGPTVVVVGATVVVVVGATVVVVVGATVVVVVGATVVVVGATVVVVVGATVVVVVGATVVVVVGATVVVVEETVVVEPPKARWCEEMEPNSWAVRRQAVTAQSVVTVPEPVSASNVCGTETATGPKPPLPSVVKLAMEAEHKGASPVVHRRRVPSAEFRGKPVPLTATC
jgi:hypothetical protein